MTSAVHHVLTHTATTPITRGGRGLGVRLCSYPRRPATVIEVGGEIDAHNAQHVTDYLADFIYVGHPLVLDLSGVDFLGTAGFSAILQFAEECRRGERRWALVSSDAVKILLRVVPNHRLPTAGSVDRALQRFAAVPKPAWKLRAVTAPWVKEALTPPAHP
jgi:anti-anti-sigma factor